MSETVTHTEIKGLTGKEIVVILIAVLLFTVLEYGFQKQTEAIGLLFLVSAVVYFLKLYIFYGLATFAFYNKTLLLAGSAIVVYIAAVFLSAENAVWTQITDWSLILFGSVVMGRYLLKDANYQRVYIYGLATVTIIAIVLYAPYWEMLISGFEASTAETLKSLRTTLPSLGYTAEESATLTDSITNGMAITTYIIPALTVLSSVMQYSIGFLVFLYVLIRRKELVKPMASFRMWKMPYYINIVIIAGAMMHFLGNEIITQIGDNLLFFLSVYYVITGLSLFEYFLTKIKMHWSMKIGMYLLLFLTAHFGYIAFVLLGFIDSFKDFRKIELLSLQSK